MPKGKKISVVLTEEEERTLTVWAAAGKTEQRYAQRVILFLAEGHSLYILTPRIWTHH